MDIADYNARWLQAWTNCSVEDVMAFYHPHVSYYDTFVPDGLQGAEALRAHVSFVFSNVPIWRFYPENVLAMPNGFCGRWFLSMGEGDAVWNRGIDFVLLEDGLIKHNEVYMFALKERPALAAA